MPTCAPGSCPACRVAPIENSAVTLVAIHQPNFLPWLGWWDKLARADVFILLDDVQFPKKGGTYMNRVQVLDEGKAAWVTVPVMRSYSGVREVREMRTDSSRPWREQIVTTLRAAYAGAPHLDQTMDVLEPLVSAQGDGLADYNERALRAIAGLLGLDTRFVRSSSLPSEGRATERLVSLVRSVGGSAYLAGGGAGGYQDDSLFAAAGLGLVRQAFAPKRYPQATADDFIAGLSVVDALMWCGQAHTAALLGC
jgi:WbqC-like protein family